MSTACLDRTMAAATGVVELHPRDARRAALAAVAREAADSQDVKVYSLLARQAHLVDLDAEFAALADETHDWAVTTLEVATETWPTE